MGEEETKRHLPETDLEAMRRHLDEMRELKKQTNESLLPKIKPKAEDSFDSFMKSKLINKKVLTRRDITLNRIIMKNIIKDHFGNDNEVISNLKLDFWLCLSIMRRVFINGQISSPSRLFRPKFGILLKKISWKPICNIMRLHAVLYAWFLNLSVFMWRWNLLHHTLIIHN